ncbi:MAG: hypothetical protein JHC95_14790, partial [Solirubrobacteraceae bacterium]|nr:hypothetical protein [Solirubrobacteraceae bacterium]
MEVIAPPTSYVERRGASMAYQAWGEGPPNVIAFVETGVHLDLMWTDPDWCEHLGNAGEAGRIAMFQQMGLGLSDRVARVPTLEEQAEDVLAIMDAEGMETATLYGLWSTTLPLVILAATAPERVEGLVLHVPYAEGPDHINGNGDSGTIAGFTRAEAQYVRERYEDVLAHWGDGRTLDLWDAPLATPRNRRTMAMLE